jgi:hypothetical protein
VTVGYRKEKIYLTIRFLGGHKRPSDGVGNHSELLRITRNRNSLIEIATANKTPHRGGKQASAK